jgi:hypothetical protein
MARRRRDATADAVPLGVTPPPWVLLREDVERALHGRFLRACATAACVPLPLADELLPARRDRLAGNATVSLWEAARFAHPPELRREAIEAGTLALWRAGVRSLAFAVGRDAASPPWPHRLSQVGIAAGLPDWDARWIGLTGGELALLPWLAELLDHAGRVGIALPVGDLEPLTTDRPAEDR